MILSLFILLRNDFQSFKVHSWNSEEDIKRRRVKSKENERIILQTHFFLLITLWFPFQNIHSLACSVKRGEVSISSNNKRNPALLVFNDSRQTIIFQFSLCICYVYSITEVSKLILYLLLTQPIDREETSMPSPTQMKRKFIIKVSCERHFQLGSSSFYSIEVQLIQLFPRVSPWIESLDGCSWKLNLQLIPILMRNFLFSLHERISSDTSSIIKF